MRSKRFSIVSFLWVASCISTDKECVCEEPSLEVEDPPVISSAPRIPYEKLDQKELSDYPCPFGEFLIEGECVSSQEAEQRFRVESDKAVDALTNADPDDQAAVQKDLIEIQDDRIRKAAKDVDEIKTKLQAQKADKEGYFSK